MPKIQWPIWTIAYVKDWKKFIYGTDKQWKVVIILKPIDKTY